MIVYNIGKEMLKQVQHDGTLDNANSRHPELVSGSYWSQEVI